jgi:hypothetical protein
MRHALKVLVLGALLACGLAAGADAAVLKFEAVLSGANEVPPTGSTGTGLADVFWDTTAQTMEVQITFSGLLGTTTASHIHCCLASPFLAGSNVSVATTTPTFPGFPLGVNSGSYDQTFDMTLASSYNPAFVTANSNSVPNAEAALLAALIAGETYLNIHTSRNGSGEIRGFLAQVPVPEAGSLALMAGGMAALGGVLLARRRRRTA